MRPMTDTQKRVLAFLRAFYEANDQLPPMYVVARHFGWTSANAAQAHLMALWRRGLVERNELGKWRFARANTPESYKKAEVPDERSLLPDERYVVG
jgi:SOS-response transcriptional repressor LexA